MRVLQLCKKFPYPVKDGEAIAITQLSRALHALGSQLTLLCMNTQKHHFDEAIPVGVLDHYEAVHSVDVDTRVRAWSALLNLFSSASYHIVRFESVAFKQKLIEILQAQDFDIIQLETLYLAPYIPTIRQYSKARIAMRAHNAEHEIWARISQHTHFLPKKWYLQYLTKKLRNYEIAALKDYDLLIAITQRDLDLFRSLAYQNQAVVVPIGIDGQSYQADFSSYKRALSLSFIGSLDWMPNQEGLQWFLAQVWPRLQARFPDLEFHIAGRNTPTWMYDLTYSNVFIHGEVPDAKAFVNAHSVMVVPLLSGSGMRAKILEGMALGKIVLTTSVGLEGIAARHQKEVLIANEPGDFVDGIRFCYEAGENRRGVS